MNKIFLFNLYVKIKHLKKNLSVGIRNLLIVNNLKTIITINVRKKVNVS